ncbi:hypothetical protein TCAL_03259 [Tigriopus californicus]|uniref:WxxW domain-containing protein n=1 Tax=Tigriopus californicus TaxID=6832 RepID=A0A553NVM9_TIGCA|nr:hypothetical protein TCAL_03259 [Tigriopus californicus]
MKHHFKALLIFIVFGLNIYPISSYRADFYPENSGDGLLSIPDRNLFRNMDLPQASPVKRYKNGSLDDWYFDEVSREEYVNKDIGNDYQEDEMLDQASKLNHTNKIESAIESVLGRPRQQGSLGQIQDFPTRIQDGMEDYTLDVTVIKIKERVKNFRFRSHGQTRRLGATVKRWPHQERLDPNEPLGCGFPVCAMVDMKPMRFQSLCNFTGWMQQEGHVRRVIEVQKGGCEDAIESVGLDRDWAEEIVEQCQCGSHEGCNTPICLNDNGHAKSFASTCAAVQYLKGKTQQTLIGIGLGTCRDLYSAQNIEYPAQFQTLDGYEQVEGLIFSKDKDKVVCYNEHNKVKPKPPHYWVDKEIPKEDVIVDPPVGQTLFDTCDWLNFMSVSNGRGLGDVESRSKNAKFMKKSTCKGSNLAPQFIDARTIKDDTPWHETGELITKVTPTYGFYCDNKNNEVIGKRCSDYKVRFCCKKERPAQWGKWSEWTECSQTCGGGTKKRDRVCILKEGKKQGCFNDGPHGEKRFREMEISCNEVPCPHPQWTKWGGWGECSVSCGVGCKTRRRACVNIAAGNAPLDNDAALCLGPSIHDDACDVGYCPGTTLTMQDGAEIEENPCVPDKDVPPCPAAASPPFFWSPWAEWSACLAACGSAGQRTRKRKCFGNGANSGCPGKEEEEESCESLCPPGFRIKDELPMAYAVIHAQVHSNRTSETNLDERIDSSEKYDSFQRSESKDANQLEILKAFTDEQFREEIIKDLDAKDPNGINIPAEVVQVKRKPNKWDGATGARDLDAMVQRWEHRSGLDPEDVDGCGSPVCANVDGRPKRFRSWCNLATWMMANEHIRRFLHIQKGDCADAIEGKGHDWNWGSNPGSCERCQASVGCREKVCIAAKGVATTYTSICEAMKASYADTDVVTILFALGDCENLLNEQSLGCLYTEWFDIDEPCYDGDTESTTQNMAMINCLPKSGRFRMCPRIRQVGEPQFRTIEGGEIPKDQKINGQWKVDMPEIGHLYEECEWMPFVSQESPRSDTWDAEDRATALTTKYKRHVCGGNIFDAVYIDARTREDDIPWDETGEIITKNTPSYGFLCINKNNKPFNKRCSDYKVRYCCLKKRPAQWGEWNEWTDCTKTCGGGIRSRDRVCNSKKGNKETCFGNWIDLDESGKDRHANLKYQEHACNLTDNGQHGKVGDLVVSFVDDKAIDFVKGTAPTHYPNSEEILVLETKKREALVPI